MIRTTCAAALAGYADSRDTLETAAASALSASTDAAVAGYAAGLAADWVTYMGQQASSPLNNYRSGMAQAASNWATGAQGLLARYDAALASNAAAQTAALNTDRDDLTSDGNAANMAQAGRLAKADHDQSVAYASATADLTCDTTKAAAAQQYGQTWADVQYQDALATANATFNNGIGEAAGSYLLSDTTEGGAVEGAVQQVSDQFLALANIGLAESGGQTVTWIESMVNSAGAAADQTPVSTSQAGSNWTAAQQDLAATRAQQIGAAQVALAGHLGEAEVSYATAMGNAQTAYSGNLDTADTDYASDLATAANDFAGDQAEAQEAHANRLAEAQARQSRHGRYGLCLGPGHRGRDRKTGPENGTSLILTREGVRANLQPCRELPELRKLEWSTTFSTGGTAACASSTSRTTLPLLSVCSPRDSDAIRWSCSPIVLCRIIGTWSFAPKRTRPWADGWAGWA